MVFTALTAKAAADKRHEENKTEKGNKQKQTSSARDARHTESALPPSAVSKKQPIFSMSTKNHNRNDINEIDQLMIVNNEKMAELMSHINHTNYKCPACGCLHATIGVCYNKNGINTCPIICEKCLVELDHFAVEKKIRTSGNKLVSEINIRQAAALKKAGKSHAGLLDLVTYDVGKWMHSKTFERCENDRCGSKRSKRTVRKKSK